MKAVGSCSLILVVCLGCAAQIPLPKIKVDQVGYQPEAPKIALVTATATSFEIKNASDGSKVFEGKLSSPVVDPDTGDSVQYAEFSGLAKTGQFYLEIAGVGKSPSFRIAQDVYTRPFYLATRAFYGQRCGTAVDLGNEFPGFSHPICHKNGDFDPSSGKQGSRPNLGGWHDAGDYGRYLPTSGISTGTLLWSYE